MFLGENSSFYDGVKTPDLTIVSETLEPGTCGFHCISYGHFIVTTILATVHIVTHTFDRPFAWKDCSSLTILCQVFALLHFF